MKADVLDLECINLKSAYEHKKNMLSAFKISMIVMILMGNWKCFYDFAEKTEAKDIKVIGVRLNSPINDKTGKTRLECISFAK